MRPLTQERVFGRVRREYRYYRALIDDPRTPHAAKWLIGGGVGYLMLPLDLIPDFIPLIGKLDDMLIAPALIGLGMKLVPEDVKTDDRSRSRRIRRIYGDGYSGSVQFQSAALPGPFGIRIDACRRNPGMDGPVLFPLLDLVYEYGLVVVIDKRKSGEEFDGFTLETATTINAERCGTQTQLDVNFRPLPLVAALMYHGKDTSATGSFINSTAAFNALPNDLGRRLEKLRLRWRPCKEIRLEAVLAGDRVASTAKDGALQVSGAQFINLLMNDECEIVDSDCASVSELQAELREHVLQDRFCYKHEPVTSELLAWNPRQVLHIPNAASQSKPQYVYPGHLEGTMLGH
ncbi:MAG: DUF1232 domain-containing protein [Gammaproteobacteria bacterium]|nr:DUF1232 domain-containing protein [Gammaproteobacteria bacterium]NNL50362.1 DUF1232 domain-containing protein [Woeseiaceae bacterium]